MAGKQKKESAPVVETKAAEASVSVATESPETSSETLKEPKKGKKASKKASQKVEKEPKAKKKPSEPTVEIYMKWSGSEKLFKQAVKKACTDYVKEHDKQPNVIQLFLNPDEKVIRYQINGETGSIKM